MRHNPYLMNIDLCWAIKKIQSVKQELMLKVSPCFLATLSPFEMNPLHFYICLGVLHAKCLHKKLLITKTQDDPLPQASFYQLLLLVVRVPRRPLSLHVI